MPSQAVLAECTVCSSMGRPARSANCLGPPNRVPPPAAVIALTETAQFCSSKVLTAWLRH